MYLQRHTRWSTYTEPANEPVAVEEIRKHCRVESQDEDDLFREYVMAARLFVEKATAKALISRTIDVYFNRLYGSLILPHGPLVSVTSLKYRDGNNVLQTLASTEYELGEWCSKPLIRLAYDKVWPSTIGHIDDVVVRAVVGYGADPASVPPPLRHAIRLMAGHSYKIREPVALGTISSAIDFSVDALIRPYIADEV